MAKKKTTEDAPKQVTRVLSFDDLAAVNLDVIVMLDDGTEGIVPMRTLTYVEWMRLGFDIPTPIPPMMGYDKNARPISDFNDPTYQRQVAEANTRRMYRRLLAALRVDVPGVAVDEQLDNLERAWSVRVVRQLAGLLESMFGEGEARIQGRADAFQSDGTGSHQDLPSAGTEERSGILELASAAD